MVPEIPGIQMVKMKIRKIKTINLDIIVRISGTVIILNGWNVADGAKDK